MIKKNFRIPKNIQFLYNKILINIYQYIYLSLIKYIYKLNN